MKHSKLKCPAPLFLIFILVLRGEWGSENRYHSGGIYGVKKRMIIGIHSPTLP